MKNPRVYLAMLLFLIVMIGYVSVVMARHGVVSPEALTVLPLMTAIFGGVVRLIVGLTAKKTTFQRKSG